ncbi:MAG TPA: alpha/beta hydrolase [Geobacteraceae bacterium]|jgi:pimeloyl-ACP methyl ester carboxylesterase|nr:alpha/beta hydrolase [Geobacteraceae bacterium]
MIIFKNVDVQGIPIFYREAGPKDAPALLLLHGFPSSSHMFRHLMPLLADRFRIIAPDYPGFGNSGQPAMDQFSYTFDAITAVMDEFLTVIGLETFFIYVQDYGAPVGFRLAVRNPGRIKGIISQNGNAYEEGLAPAWEPIRKYWLEKSSENGKALLGLLAKSFTRTQYIEGCRCVEAISPDTWNMDQYLLERPGNAEIQLSLFYDYRTNLDEYPRWHDYFRTHQPPALIAWGKNDLFFTVDGALAFGRDLAKCEIHLLNTGHFALEEDAELYGVLIKRFIDLYF